nr:hypothetical protein [Curtobacterium sp. MCBA15_001]
MEDVPNILQGAPAEHTLRFTNDDRVKLVFAVLDATQQFRCVWPSHPGHGAGDFVKNFFYDNAALATRNNFAGLLSLPPLRVQATLQPSFLLGGDSSNKDKTGSTTGGFRRGSVRDGAEKERKFFAVVGHSLCS